MAAAMGVRMNVTAISDKTERRTAADGVFDAIRKDIVSLRLEPGAKLSEVEVARQFDVSRQPVREAFIRLDNMALVRIQPQRATTVRKFSSREILNARFVRTAVEVEIARIACALNDGRQDVAFKANLAEQRQAMAAVDLDRFSALDYEFHRLLCVTAEREFAYRTIVENKVYVDRLCVLALANEGGLEETWRDHEAVFERLSARDEHGLISAIRLHLSRLNGTLEHARAANPAYFED
jgi:DNA-binding GntR family transcriptional regulator